MSAGLVRGAEVPRPAPPFSVPTPDGQQLSLENLRGKVVLLEFLLTD
jgi:peroxiredoxin